MPEKRDILRNLILKSIKGESLNPDEQDTLDNWISTSENRELFDSLKNEESLTVKLNSFYHYKLETQKYCSKVKKELIEEGSFFQIKRNIRWQRYVVAASVFFLLAASYYFWTNSEIKDAESTHPHQLVINPGKDGAVLELASGQKIVLDESSNGLIAKEGTISVVKKDGQLSYSRAGENVEVMYNTLSTPRGRQYQLALPDNSRIWLNSSSEVKYPTAFIGNTRKIDLLGEVFLDVSKDANRPFVVSVAGMEVEVHGTAFNILAYPEELSIKTTLAEGSITVRKGDKTVRIRPGQQAQVKGDNISVIDNIDVDAMTAWKNGLIVLDRADINVMLRSISRWYDVEVEVKGNLVAPDFSGKLPRNLDLNKLLQMLEMNSKLKFKIEGRKVIVSQ